MHKLVAVKAFEQQIATGEFPDRRKGRVVAMKTDFPIEWVPAGPD